MAAAARGPYGLPPQRHLRPPLFWLSSTAAGRQAAARAIHDAGIQDVDLIDEVRAGLARLNIHNPQELLDWLRLYFPERGGLFQQPVEGLSVMRRLRIYGYFPWYAQEELARMAKVD